MAKFYLFAYNLVCAGGWAYVLFLVAQAFMAAGGVPKAILDAGTYRHHPPIDGARPPRKSGAAPPLSTPHRRCRFAHSTPAILNNIVRQSAPDANE